MTKQDKWDAKVEKLCYWHLWFAWFPVRVEYEGKHHKVWLEKVGRKMQIHTYYYMEYGNRDEIGKPTYCFKEDVLIKKLTDDEIIDNRER